MTGLKNNEIIANIIRAGRRTFSGTGWRRVCGQHGSVVPSRQDEGTISPRVWSLRGADNAPCEMLVAGAGDESIEF